MLRMVYGSFLEASSLLALVALLRVLVQFLLALLTLPSEIICWGAGRHGEEQCAPGGWVTLRSLPGTLRQVRNFHRRVSENLCTLSSSLVPHARLFSLHPQLVSQNSSLCRSVWVP